MPGISIAAPSVLLTPRSARGVSVLLSVEVLLLATGSVVPTGGVIVAVLLSVPRALARIVAVRVYVALPLASRFTLSLMLPVPLAAHEEPAVAVHVHDAAVNEAGRLSVTVAPVTEAGPEFDAVMVYVTVLPGIRVEVPSVLVIDRLAVCCNASVSVAELFELVGSVVPDAAATDAVFVRLPVAPAAILAVSV